MSRVLKMKHWQLFVIMFAIPMVLQIVLVSTMFMSGDPSVNFTLFPVIMILFTAFFFAWLYAMGTNLHKKLPPDVSMNVGLFRIFLLIPAAYIIFISLSVFSIFNKENPEDGSPVLKMAAYIIPLHLFSMFCIFYCLYFTAKTLKTVELQRPVTFSDFAGEFFLIWFFPVGVWIIQPRINQLFNDKESYH